MAAMRHVSIERRRGNSEAVEAQYKKYIEEADSDEVCSFYSIKYARYLTKVSFLFVLVKNNRRVICIWSYSVVVADFNIETG